MPITLVSKKPVSLVSKTPVVVGTNKPTVVAPPQATPKRPSLFGNFLDKASNFGKDKLTGRPLWQRVIDSTPEMEAYGKEQGITSVNTGQHEPLLPDLSSHFDNADKSVANYAGLHSGSIDGAGWEAALGTGVVEAARSGYDYLRDALTPEGMIANSGIKRVNLPKTFENAGSRPLRLSGLPKPVEAGTGEMLGREVPRVNTPEPQALNVTKSYPSIHPQNKAKETLLAYALQASENPEQILYPRTQPSGFSQYLQNDAAIQDRVKAKAAKADSRFRKFMEPSGQAEIPAKPWSTRMSTDAIPENLPPGKDGPIYQTVPRQLYPRTQQTVAEAIVPERLKVAPPPELVPEVPKIDNVISPSNEPAVPTSTDTPLASGGKITFKSKTPYAGGTALPEGASEKVKLPEVAKPSEHASELAAKYKTKPKLSNKEMMTSWATKWIAARKHGEYVAEDFADLKDPELIDKYQAGDRTGRLADVEKLTNEHFTRERGVGLFQGDKGKANYLRQYWKRGEVGEESVPAIKGATIQQEPNFTKESTFKTYKEGEDAGFTKKFNSLPEILARREFESKQALANKELYDYLKATDQIATKKGVPVNIRQPSSWAFKGPQAKQLQKYFTNVTIKNPPDWLKFSQEFASRSKNLYLGGGIPYTPLNIHGYNIARTELDARGAVGAWNNIRGTLNPSHDVQELKRLRPLIRKMIDYGYGTHTENLPTTTMDKILNRNFVTRAANKVMHKTEEIFEDPLFQVRMPAAKGQFAEKIYNEAKKRGASEEKSLREAAEVANSYFGGLNRPLRSATTKAATQLMFLAPDWAETQLTRGSREVKSLFGKQTQAGSQYRKSFGRAVGRRVAAAGITSSLAAAGFRKSDKPTASENIPAGQTTFGKSRELQTYGTANENLRIPEHILAGIAQGDFSPLTDIVKNRLSTPAKTAHNIVFNVDDFDNKLSGKDRFGKPIAPKQAAINYLTELGAPIEPQIVQALVGYAENKQGGEEAVSQAVEFPVTYRSQPKGKPGTMSVKLPTR
jgi:hypothetical protein